MPKNRYTLVAMFEGYSEQKKKSFYKVTLSDSSGHCLITFVDKNRYDKLKNFIYKDITDYCSFSFSDDCKTCNLNINF